MKRIETERSGKGLKLKGLEEDFLKEQGKD